VPTVILNLFLTILAELPVHLLGFRKHPTLQVGLVCILLNGFTLPLATWFYFSYGMNYWVMEGGVMLVEGVVLALVWENKNVVRRILVAFLISVVANAASITLGELIYTNLGN
jgi:hypothetical protein